MGGLKKIWSKKKDVGGTGGETQALPLDPPLLYRYSGFLVNYEVPSSVGLDRSSPLSFFSLWLSVDFNGTPTRGQENTNEKKLNRPFGFKCSIKVKLSRFALYSWNAGKEIFFSRARYARAVLLFC